MPKKFTWTKLHNAILTELAKDHTLSELHRHFEVSRDAISRQLAVIGVREYRRSLKWTPAVVERLFALEEQGLTHAKIAAELGCTMHAVGWQLSQRRRRIGCASSRSSYPRCTESHKREIDRVDRMMLLATSTCRGSISARASHSRDTTLPAVTQHRRGNHEPAFQSE